MGAIEKYFGAETAKHIEGELRAIDSIEKTTIGALEKTDAMTDHARGLVRVLGRYGVNANNLTVAEAQEVADFATGTSDEIIDRKVNKIYDAVMRHIEGAHSRRDGAEPAYYNEEEYKRKVLLQDKYVAWERGEFDRDREFDVESAYERLIDEGYEPSRFLRRHLEEDDFDELYEEGLVDEDDRFMYGPFTSNDLDNIEIYKAKTWTDITSPRYNGGRKRVFETKVGPDGEKHRISAGEIDRSGASLSSLIGETVAQNTSASIEGDLVYDYIATEILQTRRLSSKDLLIASSAVALDILDRTKPEDGDDGMKKEYDSARRSASYIAYYAAQILGYRSAELKERFNSTRPLDQEFFKEVAGTMTNMSEERASYIDEHHKQFLTKMDEHLHDALDHLAVLSSEQVSPLFSDELD